MRPVSVTSADGTGLNLRRWTARDRAIGAVLLVPGLAEHYGRYDHVAAATTRAGFETTLVELRGHGGSEGKRGHVDAWSRYEDDLRAAAAHIGGPFYLVAHSMGGLVALSALLSEPGLARGVVLSNPLLGVAVQAPPLKLAAAQALSKVLPRLSLSNELDVEAICRDPDVVRAYRQDPKVYSTITPRWYTEASAAMERVHAAAGNFKAPLLMLLGTGDRICDHQRAAAFYEAYGGADKSLCRFEGYYHELFNEPEKDDVLEVVLGWLRRRDGEATETPVF
jgi:alpha-beta hydrolase superfamily lysophospholipase